MLSFRNIIFFRFIGRLFRGWINAIEYKMRDIQLIYFRLNFNYERKCQSLAWIDKNALTRFEPWMAFLMRVDTVFVWPCLFNLFGKREIVHVQSIITTFFYTKIFVSISLEIPYNGIDLMTICWRNQRNMELKMRVQFFSILELGTY